MYLSSDRAILHTMESSHICPVRYIAWILTKFSVLAATAFMPLPAMSAQPNVNININAPELIRLVRQDCGSCHGMTLKGGLGSPLTREALADRPAESLAATILYGRPGSAMPPWKTLLSENEANWIAEQLLRGFPEEQR